MKSRTIQVYSLNQFVRTFLTTPQAEQLREEINNKHTYGDTSFAGMNPAELVLDLQAAGVPVPEWLVNREQEWLVNQSTAGEVLFEITNQSCLLED